MAARNGTEQGRVTDWLVLPCQSRRRTLHEHRPNRSKILEVWWDKMPSS